MRRRGRAAVNGLRSSGSRSRRASHQHTCALQRTQHTCWLSVYRRCKQQAASSEHNTPGHPVLLRLPPCQCGFAATRRRPTLPRDASAPRRTRQSGARRHGYQKWLCRQFTHTSTHTHRQFVTQSWATFCTPSLAPYPSAQSHSLLALVLRQTRSQGALPHSRLVSEAASPPVARPGE